MKHQKEYERRIIELQKVINTCEKALPSFPKGIMRISRDGKRDKYFYITEQGDTNGRYIRKEDSKLIMLLAKKEYYAKLLREARCELNATELFLKRMAGHSPEEVYDKLSEGRRAVVTPLILSDKEYAREWQMEQYQGNPYNPEELIYDTKRGDKVRSKSEARIADVYYELGIPYRYEYPVLLDNGKTKYPDFTLLKLPERKMIYHEHLGCLEDGAYRRNNLVKLQEYSSSGINSGNNLILTFETEYAVFNVNDFRKMVKDTLLI